MAEEAAKEEEGEEVEGVEAEGCFGVKREGADGVEVGVRQLPPRNDILIIK